MLSQRRILAHEILTIPWAATYDWQGLADQAHSLVQPSSSTTDVRNRVAVSTRITSRSPITILVAERPHDGSRGFQPTVFARPT
jgi:hypothetical protein